MRDPRVDHYVEGLPEWQRQICLRLRELIHRAEPEIVETIKRRVLPYFVLEGNVCALLAARDHVNLFLYDGGIVPDPEGIVTAGHSNKTARTISFRQGETLNAWALTTMVRQIVANNRAGGWRKLRPLNAPPAPFAGIPFARFPGLRSRLARMPAGAKAEGSPLAHVGGRAAPRERRRR